MPSPVLPKQVSAEVALEFTPNGVDVVGAVLRVVVLDQEGRALHSVVVGLARLDATRPGEADRIGIVREQPASAMLRHVVGP